MSLVSYSAPKGKPAELWQFVDWLVEKVGEVDGLSNGHLWNLYQEFADFSNTPSLTKGQFFVRLKQTDVQRYREGVGNRRWLYKVVGASTGKSLRVCRRA